VEYHFEWVAIFDFGKTDPTSASQTTTPKPPNVKFSITRSTSFQVEWDDQDYCQDYNLKLIPAAEERFSISRAEHKIMNLKADTEYQVL
jgi:hypothetical protein